MTLTLKNKKEERNDRGRKAAQRIPDIDEPLCIPITNIQLEKMEEQG